MQRLAILSCVRTAFARAGTALKSVPPDTLARSVLREALDRAEMNGHEIDEVIVGCAGQPWNAMNVARVAALRAGVPESVPGVTVHRNCASGFEAFTQAFEKIGAGTAQIALVGGVESMSQAPLVVSPGLTSMFERLQRAKGPVATVAAITRVRPRDLKPRVALLEALTDPVSGLLMGETGEVLAREFHVSREEQDRYALESHRRASAAQASGRLAEEIMPYPVPPDFRTVLEQDNGIRTNQTFEALQKLKPYFDRRYGTVTVGNSCPITDGAVGAVVCGEDLARERGLKPLGFVSAFAYSGLSPRRMGLGPVFATGKLLSKLRPRLTLKDFELIEINEAFAAQVIACQRAFASDQFARDELGASQALGELDPARTNVNGGAIALGHPVGATGGRLILTLLHELAHRKLARGLATLCVGGGQGAALLVEAV
jgi:acetyl-CoA C-acetyltransferase/acetyl-CoA acyltransferase